MQYKKIISFVFVVLSYFIVPIAHAAQVATPAPEPDAQEIAQMQEMDDMLKELESAKEEWENILKEMPPAEQAKIKKEAEEFAKKLDEKLSKVSEEEINQMNEEELNKFLEDIFTEIMPEEPKTEAPQEPDTKIEEEKVEEKKTAQKAEEKRIVAKQDQMAELIQDIVKKINALLVKIQGIPVFPEKAKLWTKQGKIKDWENSASWDLMKQQVDLFVQKLNIVAEKDSQTKKYRYLANILEDETLKNNLTKLKSSLDIYEPRIDIGLFGLQKISNESKKALQDALSTIGEAIYKTKIPAALDTIIGKFEPEAKKMREQEETITKKATETAKKPRVPGTHISVGKPAEYEQRLAGLEKPPYGSISRPLFNQPTLPSIREPKVPIKPREPGKPTVPGKSDKIKDSDKVKDKDKNTKKKFTQPQMEDAAITRILNDILVDFKEAATALAQDRLISLRSYIEKQDPLDETDLEIATKHIPDAMRKLASPRGALDRIKTLKRKVRPLTEKRKKKYKEELKEMFEKNDDIFGTVMEQIDKIKEDSKKIKIPAEKRYLYLADEKAKIIAPAKPAQSIKEIVPEPISIGKLQQAIIAVKEAISNFEVIEKK